MNRFLVCLSLILVLKSCDSSRVFEDFEDLSSGWAISDTVSFHVELGPSDFPYMITSQFRADISYPYSNLYYYFQMSDEKDSLIYSELREVELFEAKTGKPLGSGLGDLYHVEDVSFIDLSIAEKSKFKASIIQYMRLDTLRGIDRIGLRVNTQSPD